MAPHITLINCDQALIRQVLAGDEQLAAALNLTIPAQWSEFGAGIFEYVLDKLNTTPLDAVWWTYLPVLTEGRILLGTCGYKGQPDAEGCVEIGYEVAFDCRGRGYATEIARLLIEKAFAHPEVHRIMAHTLAEENASVKVLRKNGFTFVCELPDEENGALWRWSLERN